MGKKKSKTNYTSKGERPNVNKKTLNAMRAATPEALKQLRKVQAYAKGKNVVITIENPNKNETNKRFIKVNGRDYYKGDLSRGYNIWTKD